MQSIDTTDGESLGRSNRGAESARDAGGPVGLLNPEFGPIEALVGFGVFAVLVDRLTPAAVAGLADRFPDLIAPFTTGTAVLLWLVGGVTVLHVALDLFRPNPRTFTDPEARDAFLDAQRPSAADVRRNLVVMVLGAATALLAWETVVAVFEAMIPVVIEPGGQLPASLSLGNVAILVVFFLAVAAYARALDRLVVGGAREFLYRHYTDDWE